MASFVTVNPIMAERVEDLAVARSSKADTKFDEIIGHIEDIIMDDEFQTLQRNFMETYYTEFEDSEENKLCYTEIHKQYTDLVEKFIGDQLNQRMTDFDMAEFHRQLISRKNELEGEIFEMLMTFSDFLAFKEIMLDYRADKEGQTIDFSSGFTVTSLGGAPQFSGLSVGGAGISCDVIGSATGDQVDLMDSEDVIVDSGSGEPASTNSASDDAKIAGINQEQMDMNVDSPHQ